MELFSAVGRVWSTETVYTLAVLVHTFGVYMVKITSIITWRPNEEMVTRWNRCYCYRCYGRLGTRIPQRIFFSETLWPLDMCPDISQRERAAIGSGNWEFTISFSQNEKALLHCFRIKSTFLHYFPKCLTCCSANPRDHISNSTKYRHPAGRWGFPCLLVIMQIATEHRTTGGRRHRIS